MFVIGNFLFAVGRILDIVLGIYIVILFARAVLSWFDPDPYGSNRFRPRMPSGSARFYVTLKYWLILVTEPLLKPIRRYVRIPGIPIDIAFIVLLLGVYFLKFFLVGSIMSLAVRLR
jgi:YggT family protein